jgi:MSHA pilin protein MshD
MSTRAIQTGISLIELVIFIVVVSVGVAGILSVMNVTVMHSADPIVQKQASAIAESLLEEVELQPFTWCDPNDGNATTATSVAGCATTAEGMGPEAAFVNQPNGESRYQDINGGDSPFDNVNDYHGFAMAGIRGIDASATVLPGLGAYSASVAIAQAGGVFGLAADDVLRIDVRVTGPGGTDITLTGYRFRYAPNAAG